MNWRDIRILYLRELRDALRERSIVVNSLLIPLLMYPLLLWLMFSAITFVRGQEERFVSRLALLGLPAAHDGLRERLAEDEQVELVDLAGGNAEDAVRDGDLDAVAEVLPPDEVTALADNFLVRLTFDGSEDRSDKARQRFFDALDAYRSDWVRDEAKGLGIDDATWEQFYVERRDVASAEERGAFLLGLIAPLFMIIMVAIGCFHPAVDATAGERERSTWETLMTVSASRTSIVVAKYLYVATMATAAGLINLTAMTLLMGRILEPLLGGGEEKLRFAIPPSAFPIVVVALVLLALFLSAGMMIFASFARTFKEGQAMVTPFYLLVISPAIFLNSPDLHLTFKSALIPIVNVTLLFREAIAGTYNWPLIGVTLLVEVAAIALALSVARRMLAFEDFLIGSFSGNFVTFFKQRLLRRGGREQGEQP